MNKKIVKTDKAPLAIGPYSQAVVAGSFLYTSGMIAIDPQTGELSNGNIETQTHLVITNLKALIQSMGADLDDVVKTTVFLNDMNNFKRMNTVYAEYFSDSPPARSTVEVSRLPKDVLVEIDCIVLL